MNVFDKASWIWLEDYDTCNVYVSFYDKLNIKSKSGRYIFRISVDTNYALYINGCMAATGQYADYPFDKVYDELDLTDFFAEGSNNIRIDCCHQGIDTSTARNEKAGLIYTLDNGGLLLASSENTLAAPYEAYKMGKDVEMVTGQLGYTFYYDSRTDDGKPVRSKAVDKPLPARKRPVEKLVIGDDEPAVLTVRGSFKENSAASIGQRMQYASLTFSEPNASQRLPDPDGIKINGEEGVFAIIDVGRESAGILSLDLDLPCDAEILIGWGEHLEDMRVRAYVSRNFAASYYGHKGRNVFVNPFRRLGMRYLELHVYAPSVNIRYAGIRPTDYPVTDNIDFKCADSLHNRIYEVSKRTLLMCMHEHYEDCPWREQALYSMDSRNQMLCGYYTFREFNFAKASLRLMAESIRSDDMLELCSPARVIITIPSFTAIFIRQVYEYMMYSGDMDFAAEIFPVLKRIADRFISRIDSATGLIPRENRLPYWNFYEWQTGLANESWAGVPGEDGVTDAPLNAFVALALASLNSIVGALNYAAAEKDYYLNMSIKLTEAINKYFWNADEGAYASYLSQNGNIYHYCELTNSLILYADASPDEIRAARHKHVRQALASEKLIPVTLSHSIFKYDVLLEGGSKQYARYVFTDIAKKWGYMLSKDATTFWETIDGASAFGNAGSLCHGWSAIPAYFYHKYALNMSGEDTGLYECSASK